MRFDLATGCLVARVVYDGSGSAGKTTNVRQLASSFRAAAVGDEVAPVELAGRTMYFDWLTMRAGHVGGFPLVCEVLTVPGQPELAARRARILESADVVVHVCDARREALDDARANLAWTRARLGPAPVIVLQANKQDALSSLGGPALLGALGEAGPVVEAIARDGIGVVDTFLCALRALTRSIEERGDERVAASARCGPNELLESLDSLPIDRAWLAELALEEAAELFARPPRAPRVDTPECAPPVLPGPAIPPGHVWPALLGRSVLTGLASTAAYAREARASVPADTPIAIGGWELWTSRELRFEDGEAARASLVRKAREHAQLQRATEGDAILVLERADDDALWLWTLRPRDPLGTERASA